ncbi:type II toxin-antitoxin system PemK/MazF family toxin [Marinilabilia sp.]|uniref:type II toxin-antitoxin system PemK/MazF family toxin n=1 Tax=Marinilabilia sp. TaxID=2021252 RepID=UPI0025BD28AB|nr:type II toxin-antitoxin system PemK/MazF family toxin [Marinilabilia sp.]
MVPFPFDDFSSLKVRPALCLTEKIGKFEHVIIAFISSKVMGEILESDIIIRKNSEEWKDTGLVVDSVIRLHKMVTIPGSLIQRKLGHVNSSLKAQIREKIQGLFY